MVQPPLAPRPKIASVFMAIPVVFGGLLMLAMVSLLALSNSEGCIRGERIEVQFQTNCGEPAAQIISARVEMMGLGEPNLQQTEDTITLVATFPGYSDTENQTIPETLAATGVLQLLAKETIVLERKDIESAQLNQDEDGMPIVEIKVTEAAAATFQAALDADPEGSMQFMLDGDFLVNRPNSRPLDGRLIRILVDRGDVASRMQRMADLNILLNTQLMPCAVQVQSIK
jgi:preprotein translocase subunit SecD